MDTLSNLRPPKDLLAQAGPFMPWLPPDAEEREDQATREVLAGLAEWLAQPEVQEQIGAFLDDLLTDAPILPAEPYERRMHLSSIVEAIQYVIGVR